jgi:hypothetical protein
MHDLMLVYIVICLCYCAHAVIIRDVFLDFGRNLGYRVKHRILSHISSVPSIRSYRLGDYDSSSIRRPEDCVVLGFGNSSVTNRLISASELESMPYESFRIVQTVNHPYSSKCKYMAVSNGLPLDPHSHMNISFGKHVVHYGAVVGAYALLEKLGFRFLHPLEPYSPRQLSLRDCEYGVGCDSNITESPYWPERSFHIHTQHPLELTEVLQGYDIPQFGPHGPFCSSYSKRKNDSSYGRRHYCERWEDMVDDVNRMFEWIVANRQNKVEWLLLGNFKWGDEADMRIKRFRILTSLAHDFSLLVGADCPLINQQQHGW